MKTISKQSTNNIKGILIILIIIGHLSLLSSELRYILYSFHVIIFFLLPFLYIETSVSINEIKKLFKRVYIPFFIFYLTSFILYNIFYLHQTIEFNEFILGLIVANSNSLDQYIGIKAYWFLPAYIIIILFLLIYNSSSKRLKIITFLFFLISHFIISMLQQNALQSLPYNLYIVFYLFSLGLIFKYLYYRYDLLSLNFFYSFLGFLFCSFIVYGNKYDIAIPIIPNFIDSPFLFLSHDFLIFFAFLFLLKISTINNNIIQYFGITSIAIYTIHPLVIQGLKLFLETDNLISNIIIFILTIAITLLIIKALDKLKIYKVIYPR